MIHHLLVGPYYLELSDNLQNILGGTSALVFLYKAIKSFSSFDTGDLGLEYIALTSLTGSREYFLK